MDDVRRVPQDFSPEYRTRTILNALFLKGQWLPD
jgi:hypothetical protein